MRIPEIHEFLVISALFILMVSMGISMVRLVKGPLLADRVIALDQISLTILAIAGSYSVLAESSLYIDFILIVSMVLSIGTITVARYIHKQKNE